LQIEKDLRKMAKNAYQKALQKASI